MDSTIRTSFAKKNAAARYLVAPALCIAAAILSCGAAESKDIAPELLTRVWLDGGSQIATVNLNGEELARFKSAALDDVSADEAEELSARLQEILSDKKFDPNNLVASRDENTSIIKIDGNTVCSFDPLAGQSIKVDAKKQAALAYEASFKMVNAIRSAYGVPALPAPNAAQLADQAGSKLDILGQTFSGSASWYGGKFHGRKCSDGSRFDQGKLTAAHRSLPFGTKLLVKNQKTGATCVVEVNDRGPFIDGRIIDLSRAAAKELNMLSSGVAFVECTVLQ